MRKILPVALVALVIGTGAVAAQTGTWAPPAPDLPVGAGGEAALSPEDVRVKLEAQGYTNVSDVSREGEIYNAYAVKDGTNKRLRIDGRDGKILASIDAP
jgi:hypothetical protein